ncbi:hypothetical protein D6827_03910, partial [Candidatus Parcubacteria bacterium]
IGIPEKIANSQSGIAKLYTGFGKTIIAFKVAELLQQKTLIITPKEKIFSQFVAEYRKYFGENIGIIRGKIIDIKPITVATVQSLRNRLSAINPNEFGCVIVDECHLLVPEKSRRTIEYFNAYYRYGFSATPERTDGQGEAIHFIFGDIIVEKTKQEKLPIVEIIKFPEHILMGEYHDIIYDQITNEKRNNLIAAQIYKAASEGRKIIVLTKRIEHYERIYQAIRRNRVGKGKNIQAYIIRAGSNQDKINGALDSIRSGRRDFHCILGSYSSLSTGFDLVRLDTIILAGDIKSHVLTTQSVGRILRAGKNKKHPKVIDIYDTGNPILKNQGKRRQKFYKQRGWRIINEEKLTWQNI